MPKENINTPKYWDDRYGKIGPGPRQVWMKLENHRGMYLEVVSKCYDVIGRNPTARILDIGSGPGFLGFLLHSRNHLTTRMRYCAVDFSREAEKGFKEFFIGRDYAKFIRHNLDRPFPPEVREEKWDVVVSTECLEHLTDDVKVLKAMTRLVSDEGKIVVAVPSNVNIPSPDGITSIFRKAELNTATSKVDRWWIISATRNGLWS